MKNKKEEKNKYTFLTKYVDIETGEEIYYKEAELNYYIIKTHKYVTQPKRTSSKRVIEYTKLVRKRTYSQANLFTTNRTQSNTKHTIPHDQK